MLIRIDRSTLRRNPDAGRTTTTFSTGPTEARGTYDDDTGRYDWVWGDACLIIVGSQTNGPPRYLVGESYHWSLFVPENIKCTVSRPVATLHHPPEPEWLYNYESTPVTCTECGETFPVQELGSDCAWSGDDEICSFAVCPKCGEWECCEVEYEKPDDVAAATGL